MKVLFIIILSFIIFFTQDSYAQETARKPVSINEVVQINSPVKKDKNEVVVQNKLRRIGEPAISINPENSQKTGQDAPKGEVIYNKPRKIGEPANIKAK